MRNMPGTQGRPTMSSEAMENQVAGQYMQVTGDPENREKGRGRKTNVKGNEFKSKIRQ